MLEQGAGNLSGGQKQRLCIARALVGKAKILIFDDSTSAVDTATEKKIREALAARKDVTKLIIAQRITSVMNTDQIVILEDGKVHCTGRHKELLAHDPIYQEIYRSQMSGEQENEIEENRRQNEKMQMPETQEKRLQKDAQCVGIKDEFVSEACERRGE